MCRLFLAVARLIYVPISADLKGERCLMAIDFRWESLGSHRPPLQQEFLRGPRHTIGQAQQVTTRFCGSFAESTGSASTLRRFNASRANRSPFRQIPIVWVYALMVRN